MAAAGKLHMHCDLSMIELPCIRLVVLSCVHSLLISRPKLHSNILPRQETTLSVVKAMMVLCAQKPLSSVHVIVVSSTKVTVFEV